MISNVLYENIILDAPEQWAVWIGPAQQSVSSSLCNPHPCRLTVMKITMVMMMVIGQYDHYIGPYYDGDDGDYQNHSPDW